MLTAGIIYDIYDDTKGLILRKLASPELPAALKTASLLGPHEHAALPDRLFAVVLENDGEVLRKYAMHDRPHLATSVHYFLECGHLLPESAQKIAAHNLCVACDWYDATPPEVLLKRAGLLDAAMGAVDLGSRAMAGAQKHREAMQGMRAASMPKVADLRGTEMMSASGHLQSVPNTRNNTAGKAQTKTASLLPNRVDVTSFVAPTMEKKAFHEHFAITSEKRYPIDSLSQVKDVAAYFDTYCSEFEPEQRREFAKNLWERGEELGLKIAGKVRDYCGEGFGDVFHTEMLSRTESFSGTPAGAKYASLLLETMSGLGAEETAQKLAALDAESGADQAYNKAVVGFRDAYASVFAKTAEPELWSWQNGTDYVTAAQLQELATDRYPSLDRAFGIDFRKSFQKDPVGIFKSLPDPQQTIIARLAADDSGRS